MQVASTHLSTLLGTHYAPTLDSVTVHFDLTDRDSAVGLLVDHDDHDLPATLQSTGTPGRRDTDQDFATSPAGLH